jgi:hypothetical protein
VDEGHKRFQGNGGSGSRSNSFSWHILPWSAYVDKVQALFPASMAGDLPTARMMGQRQKDFSLQVSIDKA